MAKEIAKPVADTKPRHLGRRIKIRINIKINTNKNKTTLRDIILKMQKNKGQQMFRKKPDGLGRAKTLAMKN